MGSIAKNFISRSLMLFLFLSLGYLAFPVSPAAQNYPQGVVLEQKLKETARVLEQRQKEEAWAQKQAKAQRRTAGEFEMLLVKAKAQHSMIGAVAEGPLLANLKQRREKALIKSGSNAGHVSDPILAWKEKNDGNYFNNYSGPSAYRGATDLGIQSQLGAWPQRWAGSGTGGCVGALFDGPYLTPVIRENSGELTPH